MLFRSLVGQALGTGVAAAGATKDCEAALAERLRRYGARVLAAPIATTGRIWGVVLVVQRRGSLFPEDDLRLLVQLGHSGRPGTGADSRRWKPVWERSRVVPLQDDLPRLAGGVELESFLLGDRGCFVRHSRPRQWSRRAPGPAGIRPDRAVRRN